MSNQATEGAVGVENPATGTPGGKNSPCEGVADSWQERVRRVLACMEREGVDWHSRGYRDPDGCVHIPPVVAVDIRKGQ